MMQQMVARRRAQGKKPSKKSNPQSPNPGIIDGMPLVTLNWAYTCFVLNILLPGVGTMLSGMPFTQVKHPECIKKQVAIGFLQLLTAILLIGWIFSILWGYALLKASKVYHSGLTVKGEDIEQPLIVPEEREG
eukprot:CAMPEP_0115007870 /NCGR_PEP_ID=MMETSP0216-20121206/21516_1 /TAXON_ID=223996 /ORGANISM="Protocruzia adherens, Strain Boccale" /LENGTH=132 /DNA_ID=CAMNT_0002375053 /DNA_START=162 /DNA_END=560 /DNA_ORIENTATION=+